MVDDFDQRARRRLFLREDQHAAVGIDGAHALDVGAHGTHVDGPVVDPDLAVVEDLDLDALVIRLLRLLERGRPIDLQPDSLTKTAVMMKKMSRLMTKSSIGARSMPVCS